MLFLDSDGNVISPPRVVKKPVSGYEGVAERTAFVRKLSFFLVIFLAVAWASPGEARPRRETPEDLYDTGLRQMKRGYYDEAITSFDKVRNHFPLNQYSVLSELRVADCLYEKADFISAVDAYQQFVRLHPRHEELDYAKMRIGRSYFKQANRIPAKDQTYTEMTLSSLDEFEDRFPESDYLTEVLDMRARCRTRLSRAEVQVGDFYFWRKSYNAAQRRYQGLLLEYPDSPVVPRARYRLGVSLVQMGQPDEGEAVLRQVIELHPESPQVPRAQRWIKRIEADHARAAEPDAAAGVAPDGHGS